MNHSHLHQPYRFLKEAFPILLLFLTVFVAVQKLNLHHQFYLDLYNSFPLSKSGARVAAITLPLSLLVIAGLLITSATRKAGLISFLAGSLGYCLSILYLWYGREQLPCSCGGLVNYLSWPQQFILSLTLAVMTAIYLYKFQPKNISAR